MEDSQLQRPHAGMTKTNSRVFKKVIHEGVGDLLFNLSFYQIEYKYDKFRAIADISNGEEPLPGHVMALATMKDQEEAEFWISCELLSLAKKGDVLIRMKIISVQLAKHHKQNEYKFHEQFGEAVRNYAVARDRFQAENFHAAIDIYRKWTEIIENIQPANESQDLKQKTCLKKMYQNWSICCIKLCDPQQCREAVTKYKRIAPVEENPKVLYAKGKALMMFNKFLESRKCLKAAERLAPNDEVIKKALEEVKQNENEKTQTEASVIGEKFVKLNLKPTRGRFV
jgi:tetratricopeptide (TPR) repeat protein